MGSPNIYLSSMAIRGKHFTSILRDEKLNWIKKIELSAGNYDPNINKNLNKLVYNNISFLFHNYFPVPSVPFVINLCSENEEIYTLSKQLIMNAIQKSSEFGIKNYAFHAGFFVDPDPKELGKIFSGTRIDTDAGLVRFHMAVTDIASFARELGVNIMIENNVLTLQMRKKFGPEVLMCTSIENTKSMLSLVPSDVKLLLDLGHLKVNSTTLGYSIDEYISTYSNQIAGLHLSDNDGYADQNRVFYKSSWLFNYVDLSPNFISTEVYDDNLLDVRRCFEQVQEFF